MTHITGGFKACIHTRRHRYGYTHTHRSERKRVGVNEAHGHSPKGVSGN